ncbi:MAG: hypothetical protein WAK55_17160 [Xanthobacteraceae bacterium]
MLTYVFHVQHKDGDCDEGLDFYQGDMPRAGEIIQLVVRGETLKGRVGVVSVPQSTPQGDRVIHVYVEEV